MARNLRKYLFLTSWMSRSFIILAVLALGQDSRDSGIDMCATHNFTYSNTIDIHKNADTTNAEKCQCDVYVSGSFQLVIIFSFPQTVVECGEGFTIHLQGQTIVQRCSLSSAAYSENDKAYYSIEHIQIIYRSSGKEATSGWLRAKINASGRMIHVACNINEAKDPPMQPGPGSPGNATIVPSPVGPAIQPSPPPHTGPEKELTTPSGPGSGEQKPPTSRPGSGVQPPQTPGPRSGDQQTPRPGSGDQPNPTPSPASVDQPNPTPRHGLEDQPPTPPSPGDQVPSPPMASNLTIILISMIAFVAVGFVAGFIGGVVFARRRKKRKPEGKPNTGTETEPRYEELTLNDHTNQAFTPCDTSRDVNPQHPLDHVSSLNQYEELSTTSRGENRQYTSLQHNN